jgi:hypothetical protein
VTTLWCCQCAISAVAPGGHLDGFAAEALLMKPAQFFYDSRKGSLISSYRTPWLTTFRRLPPKKNNKQPNKPYHEVCCYLRSVSAAFAPCQQSSSSTALSAGFLMLSAPKAPVNCFYTMYYRNYILSIILYSLTALSHILISPNIPPTTILCWGLCLPD